MAFAQTISNVQANGVLVYSTEKDNIDISFSAGGFSEKIESFAAELKVINSVADVTLFTCEIKNEVINQDCANNPFVITRDANILGLSIELPVIGDYNFQIVMKPLPKSVKNTTQGEEAKIILAQTVHNIQVIRNAPPKAFDLKPIQPLNLMQSSRIPFIKSLWNSTLVVKIRTWFIGLKGKVFSKTDYTIKRQNTPSAADENYQAFFSINLTAENGLTRTGLEARVNSGHPETTQTGGQNPKEAFSCIGSPCEKIGLNQTLSQTSNIIHKVKVGDIGKPGTYTVEVDIVDTKGLSARESESFKVNIKAHYITAAFYIWFGVLVFGVLRKLVSQGTKQQKIRRALIDTQSQIFKIHKSSKVRRDINVTFANKLMGWINGQLSRDYKTISDANLISYRKLPNLFKFWLSRYERADDAGQLTLKDIVYDFTEDDITEEGIKAIRDLIKNVNPAEAETAKPATTAHPWWNSEVIRTITLWIMIIKVNFQLIVLKFFDLTILFLLAIIFGLVTLWIPNNTWGSVSDILTALLWGAGVNFLNSTNFVNSSIFKNV